MKEMDDHELLREYATRNSEEAFRALVDRHAGLVYHAALRQVHNPHTAEEVAQAVFIALARKAGRISRSTVLPGWLYRATRFAVSDLARRESRRQRREQEAFHMEHSNQPDDTSAIWEQITPLLDTALERLSQSERDAVLVRFFQEGSHKEVARALGISEDAAKMRVSRAVEKLRVIFAKHGFVVPAASLGTALSANAAQAAPASLAVSVTKLAAAKGAASASTLTITKGILKLMAWTKVKTAFITGAAVLLAVGTLTVAINKIEAAGTSTVADPATYPWQVRGLVHDGKTLESMPPLVDIVPTKFPDDNGARIGGRGRPRFGGLNQPLTNIILMAYGYFEPVSKRARLILDADLPAEKYDFISSVPNRAAEALQAKIKEKFSVAVKREMRETDVLLLRVKTPNAPGLKLTKAGPNSGWRGGEDGTWTDAPIQSIASWLEAVLDVPVIDQTGLRGRYNINLQFSKRKWGSLDGDARKQLAKQAVLEQLGLELTPDRQTIEMLVVTKAE